MFVPTRGGQVGLEVLVHGRSIAEYPHENETFVEARLGSEYSIRLWNRTSRQVLAVLTVDGLNVIDGKTGNTNGRGYVLNPGQHADIPGFLVDQMNAASFTFSAPGRSYAAQMDKPNNLGVIGAAFFSAAISEPRFELLSMRDASPQTLGGTAKGATRGGSAGTEYGREVDFRTHEVEFRRQSETPDMVLILRYETREELKRIGVDLRPATAVSSPNPFPANTGVGAPPPPGWRGGRRR